MAMRGRGVGIGGYRPPQPPMRTLSQTFRPKSDWRDEPNTAILILYLPGFLGDQIEIIRYPDQKSIQVVAVRLLPNDRLIRVNETFAVPVNCDLEKLETNFARGILMLKMPKKKDQPSSPIPQLNPNYTSSLPLTPIPTPIPTNKLNLDPKHPTQTELPTPTTTPNLNANAIASHTPTPTPTTQPDLDAKRPTPTQIPTPITSTPTSTPNPNSNSAATDIPTPTPTLTPTSTPTQTPTFAGRKETKVLAPENDDLSIQPCQQDHHQDQRSREKKDQRKKTDDKLIREIQMKNNGQKEMELILLSRREKRQLLVNMGVAALLIIGFIASTYNSLI